MQIYFRDGERKMKKRYFGKCEKCESPADLRIKYLDKRKYAYFCWGCYQNLKWKKGNDK